FFSRGTSLYRTDNLNLDVDSIKDTYDFLDVGETNSDPNGNNDNAVVNTIKLNTLFQYTITDIAVDPNDQNNIVVTVGGYGSFDHVYKSTNAMSDDPTFTPIQGNLPDMPVYSAVIDVNNSNNIIIGTEFGVWSTTNGSSWIVEDDGMPLVPCHMLRQQYLPGVNKGVVYVGTHGRGIFKSSNTSSVFDYTNDDSDNVNMLSIYPNPAESFINLELSSDINVYDVSIIDLMGKEVYNSNSLSSTRIDISSLEVGNYIIVVNTDSGKQLGKFVKTK
ncbi:MAG: T9SS type A sorting domain-containing protein, partial [Flavobacteriales bacterium]